MCRSHWKDDLDDMLQQPGASSFMEVRPGVQDRAATQSMRSRRHRRAHMASHGRPARGLHTLRTRLTLLHPPHAACRRRRMRASQAAGIPAWQRAANAAATRRRRCWRVRRRPQHRLLPAAEAPWPQQPQASRASGLLIPRPRPLQAPRRLCWAQTPGSSGCSRSCRRPCSSSRRRRCRHLCPRRARRRCRRHSCGCSSWCSSQSRWRLAAWPPAPHRHLHSRLHLPPWCPASWPPCKRHRGTCSAAQRTRVSWRAKRWVGSWAQYPTRLHCVACSAGQCACITCVHSMPTLRSQPTHHSAVCVWTGASQISHASLRPPN